MAWIVAAKNRRVDVKSKIITAAEAILMIKPGDCVMLGGFGGVGVPYRLIDELSGSGNDWLRDLHVVTNDAGRDGVRGVADLLVPPRVRKLTTTYVNGNSRVSDMRQRGEMEVDLWPIGSLYESIWAAGSGLGGVLTPTGVGTKAEDGKQKLELDGREYLLLRPFLGDVALIGAIKADETGNLVMRRVQKTYNIAMALAARLVIAEVEEIVPVGSIDPDEISVPGALVDHIVKV